MPRTRANAESAQASQDDEVFRSPLGDLNVSDQRQEPQNQGIEQPNAHDCRGASPLARATAVHMQLTSGLFDQVNELRRVSETMSNHLIKKDLEVNYDISSFLQRIPIISADHPQQLLEFIVEAQALFDLNLKPDTVLLSHLISRLQGEIRIWWSKAIGKYSTWQLIKVELLNEYLSPIVRSQLVDSMVRRYQGLDEPFTAYVEDIQNKVRALELNMSDEDIVLHIWTHANSATLDKLKAVQMPSTLQDLRRLARRIRDTEALIEAAIQREQLTNQPQENPSTIQCSYCKRSGHTSRSCWQRRRSSQDQETPKN